MLALCATLEGPRRHCSPRLDWLPNPSDRICVQLAVSGDDGYVFPQCLSNERAVEGVLVMEWHIDHTGQVVVGDLQQLKVVANHVLADEASVWPADVELLRISLVD